MMATLLFVKANPKPAEQSKSLTMAEEFLAVYRQIHPEDTVVTVDVYQDAIPLIDADVFSGWGKLMQQARLTAAEQAKIDAINGCTEQFLVADKYVFVAPMWNLSIPPMLKAYLDTVVIAGKTFKYTEAGPVGLVTGKKAVLILARGGVYSQPPMSEMEFAERYLRAILGFLGITDMQSAVCEGHEYAPDQAAAILDAAVARARKLASAF